MDTGITALILSAIVHHFSIYRTAYGSVIPTFIMTKAITKWMSTLGEDYKTRHSLMKLTGNLVVLNTILDIPLAIQQNGFLGEKSLYHEIFDLIKDKF